MATRDLDLTQPAPGDRVFPDIKEELRALWDRSVNRLGTTGGTATAYTGTATPAITTLVAGLRVSFVPHVVSGLAPTLNAGGGAKALLTRSGAAPPRGALQVGYAYDAEYDGAAWRVLSLGAGVNGDDPLLEVMNEADERPGDVPSRFTATLDGSLASTTALSSSLVAVDTEGSVIRLDGSGVAATRSPRRIEPTRVYLVRAVVRRRTNPTDPAGAAVELRVRWLSSVKAGISTSTLVTRSGVSPLLVASGVQVLTGLISTQSGSGVTVAPAGAVYARAYVQTYGGEGVTDVELISIRDITDNSVLTPELSDLQAEVEALVSLDIGTRLDVVEALLDGSEIARYRNRTVAAAAGAAGQIPAYVDIVETLGGAADADGDGGLYLWSATQPVETDRWQNANGSWFGRAVENLGMLHLRDEAEAEAATGTPTTIVLGQEANLPGVYEEVSGEPGDEVPKFQTADGLWYEYVRGSRPANPLPKRQKWILMGDAQPSRLGGYVRPRFGTSIGDLTINGGLAAAFDMSWGYPWREVALKTGAQSAGKASSTQSYIGKTWSADEGRQKVLKAVVYGSSDNGLFTTGVGGTVQLRAHGTSAPGTTAFPGLLGGTLLGETTIVASTAGIEVEILNEEDSVTNPNVDQKWEHTWVVLTSASASAHRVAQVVFYKEANPNDEVAHWQQVYADTRIYHPDASVLVFVGDMVGTAYPDIASGDEWIDHYTFREFWEDISTGQVMHRDVYTLSGNHEQSQESHTESLTGDTMLEGQKHGDPFCYHFLRGNLCFTMLSDMFRGTGGAIHDFVVDYWEGVQRDHQDFNTMLATHQQFSDTTHGTLSGGGQKNEERLLAVMTNPDTHVDACIAGHGGGGPPGLTSPLVTNDMAYAHDSFHAQVGMHLSSDENPEYDPKPSYVIMELTQGSRDVVFRRWSIVDQAYVAGKDRVVEFSHPVELSDYSQFDGRYQVDPRHHVSMVPSHQFVFHPREFKGNRLYGPQLLATIGRMGTMDPGGDEMLTGMGWRVLEVLPGASITSENSYTRPYDIGGARGLVRRNGQEEIADSISAFDGVRVEWATKNLGKARVTFLVRGVAATSLATLTVAGVAIISAPVAWATDDATTAAAIAANINAHPSSPDYSAASSGAYLTIFSETTGASADDRLVAYTATGALFLDALAVPGTDKITSRLAGGGKILPDQWSLLRVTEATHDRFTIFVGGTNDLAREKGAEVNPSKQLTVYGEKIFVGALSRDVSHDSTYQTVATDAAFTLTPGTSPYHTTHTGTLTANRAVTLSTVGAYAGLRYRIKRTGSGSFSLNVGTGPLIALATGDWVEVEYNGSAYEVAANGSTAATTTSSGTYTPTLTPVSNIDGTPTVYESMWSRVGNVVTVSGMMDIDFTTGGGVSEVGISLPVVSNFTQTYHCLGAVGCEDDNAQSGVIIADTTNDRASLRLEAANNAPVTLVYTFQYRVL